MSRYQSGNMAGEIWVQWFSCCINQPAAQQRKRVQQRVRRIDRSMIGSPTNFQHTGHIGSGDVDTGNSRLRAIQNQMQSKGGYETAFSTVQISTWCEECRCVECLNVFRTAGGEDIRLIMSQENKNSDQRHLCT